MTTRAHPLFSVITPSRGTRPVALGLAAASVFVSAAMAGLGPADVEMLVGFDGVRGQRPDTPDFVRYFDLPPDGNYGNGIRDILLKAAKGERVIFLDDDNALSENALSAYADQSAEMVIGRIDCARAFDVPCLPVSGDGRELVRPGNVDPLCLCLSRELVVTRCGGWRGEGGYESDFLNIVRYHRRARSLAVIPDLVGIYDAGAGLDHDGVNPRQMRAQMRTATGRAAASAF